MRRLLAVLALIALAATACSNDSDGTATPTASGSPPATPTPAPSATTNVRSGTVTTETTGDESFTVDLSLSVADSQFNPPPAGFAFVFRDDKNNLVTIGGAAFDGSGKTSGTLALGVVFNRDGRVIAHTDTTGGCDLTMKRDGKTVTGTFSCGAVEDGRYSVTGEFTVELA